MDGLVIPGDYIAEVGEALARDVRAQRERGEPVALGVLAVLDGCQAARSEVGPFSMREVSDPSTWATTESAARMLGVSRRQITRLIDRRQLRAIRVGWEWRVNPASIDTYKGRRRSA